MITKNSDMFKSIDTAFMDEFNLWDSTEGNSVMNKVDSFLKKISSYNVLLFNTKETIKLVQTDLSMDGETQDGVMLFILRVKFRFIVAGGDWNLLTTALNEISNSLAEDRTFETALEGFDNRVDLIEQNMLQALLYYYVLSPNIMITRILNAKEE